MITVIRKFLWDETAFIRYSRAGLYLLYVSVAQGLVPGLSDTKAGWWIAQFLPVIALMLGAGEKNRSPEEIKSIAHDFSITEKTR